MDALRRSAPESARSGRPLSGRHAVPIGQRRFLWPQSAAIGRKLRNRTRCRPSRPQAIPPAKATFLRQGRDRFTRERSLVRTAAPIGRILAIMTAWSWWAPSGNAPRSAVCSVSASMLGQATACVLWRRGPGFCRRPSTNHDASEIPVLSVPPKFADFLPPLVVATRPQGARTGRSASVRSGGSRSRRPTRLDSAGQQRP